MEHAALKNRGSALGLHGMGRLKPGVTIDQAQADLSRVMLNLANAYPDTNKGQGSKVGPLKQRVIGDISGTLWLLLGAVGFVLLIACVNVGNLMLAQGHWSQARVRHSGCFRGRLVATGPSIAHREHAARRYRWRPRTNRGQLGNAGSNSVCCRQHCRARAKCTWIIGCCSSPLAVSLLSGVLSGLAPALKNSKWRLAETLKESGRGNSSRSRAQSVLVAVEVALAVVL